MFNLILSALYAAGAVAMFVNSGSHWGTELGYVYFAFAISTAIDSVMRGFVVLDRALNG